MLEHDYATLGQSYVRTTPPHTPHAAVILYHMWVCMSVGYLSLSVCRSNCQMFNLSLCRLSFWGALCPFLSICRLLVGICVIFWPAIMSFCHFVACLSISLSFSNSIARCLSICLWTFVHICPDACLSFCFSFCHSDCDRRQIDNIKAGQSDLSQRWPPKHWMRPTTLLSVTAISENILRVLFQDLVKFIVNLKGW